MSQTYKILFMIMCLLGTSSCDADTIVKPADPITALPDPSTFITYLPGNMPLLILVGHGGSERPPGFKVRNCPGTVTVTDSHTLELAAQIMEEFAVQGLRPFLVTSSLHRSLMDTNRNRAEGTCNDARSGEAWDAFHGAIQRASLQITQTFGRGLLIDLHGHGHEIQRLELGYLLYSDELSVSDSLMDRNDYHELSSISALYTDHYPESSFSSLLRGKMALGSLFHDAGFPSVPSETDPHPLTGDPYFSGGYITATYGSLRGGGMDAIQMESNMTGVRDTPENRSRFAKSFSAQVLTFLRTWYSYQPDP